MSTTTNGFFIRSLEDNDKWGGPYTYSELLIKCLKIRDNGYRGLILSELRTVELEKTEGEQ